MHKLCAIAHIGALSLRINIQLPISTVYKIRAACKGGLCLSSGRALSWWSARLSPRSRGVTAGWRVQSHVTSCEICGDEVTLEQGFLQDFSRFICYFYSAIILYPFIIVNWYVPYPNQAAYYHVLGPYVWASPLSWLFRE